MNIFIIGAFALGFIKLILHEIRLNKKEKNRVATISNLVDLINEQNLDKDEIKMHMDFVKYTDGADVMYVGLAEELEEFRKWRFNKNFPDAAQE